MNYEQRFKQYFPNATIEAKRGHHPLGVVCFFVNKNDSSRFYAGYGLDESGAWEDALKRFLKIRV